jgi:ABC-type polysaccharide/polyol phosphate transport system ATPase subunit
VEPEPPERPPAIDLSGVTVRYQVAKEVVSSIKEYAIRRLQGRIEHDELVALRGVSLSVAPGDRVGVIGPNGAGKSTMMKVIARVCRPTEGRVVVRGRVAPLLQLGLGFHQELSGRENVVLQGTLLGRSRSEMEARMGAIAGFAEIEGFLDAPVRTYSTGMSARLAFATATDVDPDILLIDETLSVGDERFVAKCHGRMAGFRDRGKTFFLVSHSLAEVEKTCHRAIWLLDGEVVADGEPADVCERYREWAMNGGNGGRTASEACGRPEGV